MRIVPTTAVDWDQARLTALDLHAEAERLATRAEMDNIAARRTLQRAIADVVQAHKRCPVKECRRARACRTPQICAAQPMEQPTERQWQIIDALYADIQRRRRDAALALCGGGDQAGPPASGRAK